VEEWEGGKIVVEVRGFGTSAEGMEDWPRDVKRQIPGEDKKERFRTVLYKRADGTTQGNYSQPEHEEIGGGPDLLCPGLVVRERL